MMDEQEKKKIWLEFFKALDKATDKVTETSGFDMYWTENLISMMTDAAMSVFLASYEQHLTK